MKFKTLILIGLIAPGILSLSAAPLMQNASLEGEPTSVAELPAYLKPAPDCISLIADFKHKAAAKVTLYLINTTSANVSLASQDGDLGCKREAKSETGKWMRCDSHGYSWCGNSYGTQTLKAGQFLAWTQICDTPTGEARALRFKLYNQDKGDIVSNEGSGIVDESDVQFCRYDSLAMQQGPFEDVAAVATGKTQGGQGASINGLADAVRGLRRFKDDVRLFPTVKEVVLKLVAENAVKPGNNGYIYTDCLTTLRVLANHPQFNEELFNYVNGQLHDKSFPWRRRALEWLVSVFEWDTNKLRPVIEEILTTPSHPALHASAFAYQKVVGKSEAGTLLAQIANDPTRPEDDRNLARLAREGVFPNPYPSVKAKSGEAWGNEGLTLLKEVTITNSSPQAITFPVGKPEALLGVEISKVINQAVSNSQRYFMSDEAGSLTLQAGESVVIKDVKWWEMLRQVPIDDASDYNIHIIARTPGLWEVPVQSGWGWVLRGSQIVKTLDTKPTNNK